MSFEAYSPPSLRLTTYLSTPNPVDILVSLYRYRPSVKTSKFQNVQSRFSSNYSPFNSEPSRRTVKHEEPTQGSTPLSPPHRAAIPIHPPPASALRSRTPIASTTQAKFSTNFPPAHSTSVQPPNMRSTPHLQIGAQPIPQDQLDFDSDSSDLTSITSEESASAHATLPPKSSTPPITSGDPEADMSTDFIPPQPSMASRPLVMTRSMKRAYSVRQLDWTPAGTSRSPAKIPEVDFAKVRHAIQAPGSRSKKATA